MSVDIVVDGLPWSGKRTVGRRLAAHYKMRFLNTGDPYRAIGLLSSGDLDKVETLAKTLRMVDLEMPDLRSERATRLATVIASVPAVRTIVTDWTREATAGTRGWVLGGQNGAAEFPEAIVKLFLVARFEERLRRYLKDLAARGVKCSPEEAEAFLKNRDLINTTRQAFPVRYVDGVYQDRIDTTELTEEKTFIRALAKCEGKHEFLLRNAASM